MPLPTFTPHEISAVVLTYEPRLIFPAGWRGTALDVLQMEHIPPGDRLHIVLSILPSRYRLDDRTRRSFAVWCARSVQHLMDDPRSIASIDTAERYVHGNATPEELDAARTAAKAVIDDRMSRGTGGVHWAAVYATSPSVGAWGTATEAEYSPGGASYLEQVRHLVNLLEKEAA